MKYFCGTSIHAMSMISHKISWWDISVVEVIQLIQVIQVIKLIQLMHVSLAHLWVDFRIISTGQPLPSKIWVLEKALTHHAAKHQIFWWHSCSDVSKSVSNYCVISFEWLHRYISWCYDSITSDGNVMADHCEDGVNDYDGDDSDNSGDYCDIDYHYHYNYNYYYH